MRYSKPAVAGGLERGSQSLDELSQCWWHQVFSSSGRFAIAPQVTQFHVIIQDYSCPARNGQAANDPVTFFVPRVSNNPPSADLRSRYHPPACSISSE